MTHSYTEDALVEQPAIELFEKLGWETYNGFSEFEQAGGSPLGRETKSEVVLTARLLPVLQKLNPNLPPEAFDLAIEELTRDRSAMSLAQANREVYDLIKQGVRVKIADPEAGGDRAEIVHLIDWNRPKQNDFFLVSQFWVTGEMYTRRTDLIGFVNGIPLVFIELKAAHRRIENAYKDNLRDYRDTIPHLFWYNLFIILSNGSQSKIGSITAEWEHFSDWKRINSEGEEGVISLETMLVGTCEPVRLLDIAENFMLFMEVRGGLAKLLAKNHQYLGVNNAVDALQQIRNRQGKLGVFWHTQGSGKSVSMVFLSQKVLRKIPGNWTFVVVTDRQELDDQIYKNFANAGVVTEKRAQAGSSTHLRQLLSEDHRYVFTLIHKFRTERGQVHPVCSERSDIIVITDEAHRSQYDTLALNMRTALPNASFIAFTGTPLIVGEEKTREVFGDYVSIYNFKESVDDGATVPLYYENRKPDLQLTNEHLNEDMEQLLEEAELDEEQEKKLEREFSREYHLITRDDRLEAVAKDIVEHFIGRGFRGKAMVISIDKASAVRMYDKVKGHWDQHVKRLRYEMRSAKGVNREQLQQTLAYLEETDMAVVVSQAQNEIEEMRKKGLDIAPHRRRMVSEDLDEKFKDPEDPFRMVFVCAMWMTGFDVPCCSTLYLDKPMRNHTLMQTIARANRVFPEKENGLIVDYVGVFRNLERALAIYGSGTDGGLEEGELPVKDKSELVAQLKAAITEAEAFCDLHSIDLKAIGAATGFERVSLLDNAVEALLASDESKRQYLALAGQAATLYRAVLPDPAANELAPRCLLLDVLVRKIRSLMPEADISQVMAHVETLLDESIATEGYVIHDDKADWGKRQPVDLSEVDFEALRQRFEKGRKCIEAERLKGLVAKKVEELVKFNRTRLDYYEKFKQLIEDYNAGTMNTEEFFRRLVDFAKSLDEEESRAVAEQLSEEELAVFDVLTKPEMEMKPAQIKQIKKVAQDLLRTLKKGKLVLDWRKRQQARAAVRVAIDDVLDKGLPPAFMPDLYRHKCDLVYQHVYEAYFGGGKSVYELAA